MSEIIIFTSLCLAFIVSKELIFQSAGFNNEIKRIVSAVAMFIFLCAVLIYLSSIFYMFITCGTGGACGWILVGLYIESMFAIPVGVVASLIVFTRLSRRVTTEINNEVKPFYFRYLFTILTSLIIIVLIIGSIVSFRKHTTPQREYREYDEISSKSLDLKTNLTFEELYSFKIPNSYMDNFVIGDIDADNKKEVVYFMNGGEPKGPNKMVSDLYIGISSVKGDFIRSCPAIEDLIQTSDIKLSDFYTDRSYHNVITIVGIQEDKHFFDDGPAVFWPTVVTIDPVTCKKLFQTSFPEIRGYTRDWINSFQVVPTNNSQYYTISIDLYGYKCQFKYGDDNIVPDCVEVAKVYAPDYEKHRTEDLSEVDRSTIEKLKSIVLDDVIHGDFNGDNGVESIFFISKRGNEHSVLSQSSLITNNKGEVIAKVKGLGGSGKKVVIDSNEDGKDELWVLAPTSRGESSIHVFGFK